MLVLVCLLSLFVWWFPKCCKFRPAFGCCAPNTGQKSNFQHFLCWRSKKTQIFDSKSCSFFGFCTKTLVDCFSAQKTLKIYNTQGLNKSCSLTEYRNTSYLLKQPSFLNLFHLNNFYTLLNLDIISSVVAALFLNCNYYYFNWKCFSIYFTEAYI